MAVHLRPTTPTVPDGAVRGGARAVPSQRARDAGRAPNAADATSPTPRGEAPAPRGAVGAGGTVLDARLGAIAPPFGSPAFERLLDEKTGSVARRPCRVTPLLDGCASWDARMRLLDEAQDSIHIQTYRLTDDETGWALAKKLVEKAQAGVEVRFIYDAVGSLPTNKEIFAFMERGGVQVRARPLTALNDRWHEKHFIVDGRASVEGGMNLADEYMFGGTDKACTHPGHAGVPPFKDVDVLLEGEAVHDAQRAFLKNWATLGDPVPDERLPALFPASDVAPPGASARVVQHRPSDDGDDHTHELMLACVRATGRYALFENAYFLPPPDLRKAMCDAARAGKRIVVVTNSVESNNHAFVSEAARYFYKELIEAGVEIWERTEPPTIHSKCATFDGVYSEIGSCNLNRRSKDRDSECLVATDDPDVAARLEARMDDLLQGCRRVTLESLQQDGFVRGLKQFALSTLAWSF